MPGPATMGRAFLLGVYHRFCYFSAALAKGDAEERVYIVEPTGPFENDPNVTDKKFPGNPTRSYRSTAPLKITGEVADWVRQTPEQVQMWRQKLDNNKGAIIN